MQIRARYLTLQMRERNYLYWEPEENKRLLEGIQRYGSKLFDGKSGDKVALFAAGAWMQIHHELLPHRYPYEMKLQYGKLMKLHVCFFGGD